MSEKGTNFRTEQRKFLKERRVEERGNLSESFRVFRNLYGGKYKLRLGVEWVVPPRQKGIFNVEKYRVQSTKLNFSFARMMLTPVCGEVCVP